jgi:cytochrome c553
MNKVLGILLALAACSGAAQAQQAVQGNAEAARAKVSMCIGCHGIPDYKASYPEIYRVPKIAGQSAKYIENSLKSYQKGERNHPSMVAIAASLSDQDIADLAAYYANLKPTK